MEQPYLAAGFAVGLAIFFMERTNSVHPPGGATALVAVIGSEKVHECVGANEQGRRAHVSERGAHRSGLKLIMHPPPPGLGTSSWCFPA